MTARSTFASGAHVRIDSDRPDHWDQRAQCRDLPNAEIMWPLAADTDGTAIAAQVCVGCPVRIACLTDGTREREWDSVRGGLSGGVRRAAFRMHGLDFDAYPEPVLPTKTCVKCKHRFDPDPERPRAWLCRACIGLSYRKRLKAGTHRKRVAQ